jgi:hypothetical protein
MRRTAGKEEEEACACLVEGSREDENFMPRTILRLEPNFKQSAKKRKEKKRKERKENLCRVP